MLFDFQVAAGRAAPINVRIEAADVAGAVAQATRLGYQVIGSSANASKPQGAIGARGGPQDTVVFVEQLRDLLTAGLSVIESIDTLRIGVQGGAAIAMDSLARGLREGRSLSDALAEAGFPELLIALVRASELTSDLPQTLTRYLEHARRVAEARHRVVATAIYPILLIGVGGAVMLFLMFYVLPRFSRIFEGMTAQLPWSARAMVAWSEFLRSSQVWWLVAAGVALAGMLLAAATPAGRAHALKSLLSTGVLQRRLRIYFLARWYRATGMLVEGGIPLATALRLANAVLPLGMREGGEAVERGVQDGLSPAQAHVRAGMATPVAEQLMLAGERTGDLGGVLSRIAQFHEADVLRSLERTMRALEPIVMVLIGLGVGVVVVLMYMPIFELASAIQ